MQDALDTATSNPPPPPRPGPPEVEPLSSMIQSSQPGGGRVLELELGWGRLRRSLLKSWFPRYVADMRQRLKGDPHACPVEVVDSRDLKFHRNVAGCWFEPADDVFAWRRGIPFAHWGFVEALVFAGPAFLLGWLIWTFVPWYSFWLALPFFVFGAFVVSFFRSPHRLPPADPAAIVSPADGRITDIEDVRHAAFGGAPAVRIGVFLSVFNVHVNRMPMQGKVLRIRYMPGEFNDARSKECRENNERLEVLCCEPDAPWRPFIVRQIAGAIARRIVCELKPGEVVDRGRLYGMIKFGSRTELVLPREGLQLDVRVGDLVRGGSTVFGRYADSAAPGQSSVYQPSEQQQPPVQPPPEQQPPEQYSVKQQ